MMKTLLLSVLFLLPLLASAQKTADPVSRLTRVSEHPGSALAKAVSDTIVPEFYSLICSDTVQILGISGGDGYVMGTNAFGDLAKGQRFVYASTDPYLIRTVGVAFAIIDSSALDRYVSVQIVTDPESADGVTVLGVSDSVMVRDIAISDTRVPYTEFSFPDSIVLESDSFLILVNLSDTYTETSTYTAIFSSGDGCGNGTNSFEIYLTTSGTAFGSIQDNWTGSSEEGLNSEMYAYVVVENQLVSANRSPLTDYSAQVSPNPTYGNLTLNFRAPTPGEYQATLTNINGQTLASRRLQNQVGQGQFNLDLTDLPSGLYLYHIDGPAGRQSGKVIKR